MNKKFFKISVIMILVFLAFLTASKVVLGDKVSYGDGGVYLDYDLIKPEVKYLGYEEDKNVYKIRVGIKNKSEYIANLSKITLEFEYRTNSENSNENNSTGGNPTFSGYDKQQRDYISNYQWREDNGQSNKKGPRMGLDPGEEREYVFEITKALSFNPDNYDTNKMLIEYDMDFYKYRKGSNTIPIQRGGIGGGGRIDNKIQPFTVK